MLISQRQKRTGWLKAGVPRVESVADHSYRAALLALVLPESGVDRVRCMKMALVHDLAESIVGDITPSCGVSTDEKHRREEVITLFYNFVHIYFMFDLSRGQRVCCCAYISHLIHRPGGHAVHRPPCRRVRGRDSGAFPRLFGRRLARCIFLPVRSSQLHTMVLIAN